MAYTMIAERDNRKVRKQRESALIVLANARVMESEGWKVVILDDEGADLDPTEFEARLAQKFSSWYQIKPHQVTAPRLAGGEAEADEFEPETLVAAELAAEEFEAQELGADEFEADESELREVDEADFEDEDSDLNGADLETAEFEDELADIERAK